MTAVSRSILEAFVQGVPSHVVCYLALTRLPHLLAQLLLLLLLLLLLEDGSVEVRHVLQGCGEWVLRRVTACQRRPLFLGVQAVGARLISTLDTIFYSNWRVLGWHSPRAIPLSRHLDLVRKRLL